MRSTSALPLSQVELEGWAKLVGPILAVGGTVGGAAVSTWRWWRRRREVRRVESKDLRYVTDAVRHILDAMTPSPDGRMVSIDELMRQHALICEVRRELWAADGNALPEDEPAAIVRDFLSRTQKIQQLKDRRDRRQDMFREGDEQ